MISYIVVAHAPSRRLAVDKKGIFQTSPEYTGANSRAGWVGREAEKMLESHPRKNSTIPLYKIVAITSSGRVTVNTGWTFPRGVLDHPLPWKVKPPYFPLPFHPSVSVFQSS